jgi:hypothetical protein
MNDTVVQILGTEAKKISPQKSLNLFVFGSELLKAAEIWK